MTAHATGADETITETATADRATGDAAIMPDDKDWTWVLTRPCPDCGFDASSVAGPRVGAMLREAAERWSIVIARPGMTDRPAPHVWSPLEYLCHVRDVCRVFDQRVELMLTEDDPTFASWDQDAAAVADRYGEQDPALVTDEFADAAQPLRMRFEGVQGEQWQRTGRRSDGSAFTVETLGQYFLHDIYHHLWDVHA